MDFFFFASKFIFDNQFFIILMVINIEKFEDKVVSQLSNFEKNGKELFGTICL